MLVADYALTIGHGAMLQPGFGRNALGGLHQYPIAQGAKQVARQDHGRTTPLGQPMFRQEVGASL